MEFTLTVVGVSGQFTSQLNNVLNIGNDSNFGSFKIVMRSSKNRIFGSIDKPFSIPVRKYADNDDFISSLNRAMLNVIGQSSKTNIFDSNVFLEQKENHYKLVLPQDYQVSFSPEINYILGLTSGVYDRQTKLISTGFEFDDSINCNRNTISLLWIYADFVNSTVLGPIRDRLLALVTVNETTGWVDHRILAKQYYVPVQRCRYASLGFNICSDPGTTMEILSTITLVLHFKARNMIIRNILRGFPLIVTLNDLNESCKIKPITLRSAYNVTLQEISMQMFLDNIREEIAWGTIRTDTEDPPTRFTFTGYQYDTATQLMDTINSSIYEHVNVKPFTRVYNVYRVTENVK